MNSTSEEETKQALSYLRGRLVKQFTRVLEIWIDTLGRIYQNIISKMQSMIRETRIKSLKELRSVIYTAELDSWLER